jgi:hypothetical protein
MLPPLLATFLPPLLLPVGKRRRGKSKERSLLMLLTMRLLPPECDSGASARDRLHFVFY